MTTLMKCGHTATATDGLDQPVCATCIGINPDARLVAGVVPVLDGRLAYCGCCGSNRPSNLTLPFFQYNEKMERDGFYCGCKGWD